MLHDRDSGQRRQRSQASCDQGQVSAKKVGASAGRGTSDARRAMIRPGIPLREDAGVKIRL